jgi:spore germination cell wall hydrolase CwlJ-like protein
MNDSPAPCHASAEPRPSDFSARFTRRGRARGLTAKAAQRHIGRRLAVLAAAIAVPAMAAAGEWRDAQPQAPAAMPMPFETAGESFPGSAFYYLADQPYLPQTPAAGIRPTGEAGIALPRPAAGRIDPGPMARALLAAGSFTDRSRALQCLTMAIYYEEATEPDAGQRAVAQVVLNRVAHPSYPNTVCGVVFQGSERTTGCQFSFTCDGALARKPAKMWWDRAESVARAALAGAIYAPVGLATHYHTVQIHPYWADSLQHVGTIGAHRFYRWRGAAGRPAAFADRYLGGEPVAAPAPRLARPAETAPLDVVVDPLALARAYEAGLRTASPSQPAAPASAISYTPEVEARGGDALFRITTAPAAGQVREEYARSGQWLKQP